MEKNEYLLEFGKMTNAIENLIKNQDKHYTELKDMLQKNKDTTDAEIRELKKNIEKLQLRVEKAEKFDIKIIAFITTISFVVSIIMRLVPMIFK